MSNILDKINEAKEKQRWVAISVVTRYEDSWRYGKETTSERVVTWDTYQELRRNRRTKSHAEIVSIETMGPDCSTKEAAMEFLTPKENNRRKTKIKKGDADYIVWCMSSGKFAASGDTKWGWNLWDNAKDRDTQIYYGQRAILFGSKGSLKVGDKLCCVDNDTEKKLSGAPYKVEFVCDCTLEAFQKAFREFAPTRCKRPSYQFGRHSDGLPWGQMGQIYSIKGVAEEA